MTVGRYWVVSRSLISGATLNLPGVCLFCSSLVFGLFSTRISFACFDNKQLRICFWFFSVFRKKAWGGASAKAALVLPPELYPSKEGVSFCVYTPKVELLIFGKGYYARLDNLSRPLCFFMSQRNEDADEGGDGRRSSANEETKDDNISIILTLLRRQAAQSFPSSSLNNAQPSVAGGSSSGSSLDAQSLQSLVSQLHSQAGTPSASANALQNLSAQFAPGITRNVLPILNATQAPDPGSTSSSSNLLLETLLRLCSQPLMVPNLQQPTTSLPQLIANSSQSNLIESLLQRIQAGTSTGSLPMQQSTISFQEPGSTTLNQPKTTGLKLSMTDLKLGHTMMVHTTTSDQTLLVYEMCISQ